MRTSLGHIRHRASAGPSGFTLVEMVIVVAIIGILAAVAYPAYTSQIKRARRSDAQTAILELSQFLQRYYAAKNTFDGVHGGDDAPFEKNGWNRIPRDTNRTKTYDVTLEDTETGLKYKIRATPVDTSDPCGDLTLDDKGRKGTSAGADKVNDCWK